jgi:hypothetical protein
MSGSYVEEMRAAAPAHPHPALSDGLLYQAAPGPAQHRFLHLVLLALHAGSGGRGQWKTTLPKPSYLLEKAHTTTADGDRAGAEFSSYTFELPSDGASAIATCTALENACCLHAFEDAEMEKG